MGKPNNNQETDYQETETPETVNLGNDIPKEKSYFTPKGGDVQFAIPVQKDGKTVSEFVKFQNGKCTTSNPVHQAFFEEIIAQEAHKAPKLRRIIDEDAYDGLRTPDDTMVSINGQMMNIKEVREGIDFAIEKGWMPKYKEYLPTLPKVRVNRGGITAGNMSRR